MRWTEPFKPVFNLNEVRRIYVEVCPNVCVEFSEPLVHVAEEGNTSAFSLRKVSTRLCVARVSAVEHFHRAEGHVCGKVVELPPVLWARVCAPGVSA